MNPPYEFLCESCFARWSSSLQREYPGFTVQENAEALFYIFRRLLTEGRIKICHPFDWLGEDGLVWNATVDEKIAYLRLGWPKEATHDNDVRITLYFYEYVPAILWKGADGKWYGS